MSRQAVNRLVLGVFVILIVIMSGIYVKQEHKMKLLEEEYQRLVARAENIEYVINEYNVLIDSMDSRNFIIRMARDQFGWVFDNETVYKKTAPEEPKPTVLPDNT